LYILRPFCNVAATWCIFPRFGILNKEKSGNPALERKKIQANRNSVARWHIFKPKYTNLGTFWKALQWKMLVYFAAISYNLWPFDIMHGHLV
jgi:hypothetical protein